MKPELISLTCPFCNTKDVKNFSVITFRCCIECGKLLYFSTNNGFEIMRVGFHIGDYTIRYFSENKKIFIYEKGSIDPSPRYYSDFYIEPEKLSNEYMKKFTDEMFIIYDKFIKNKCLF